MNEKKTITMEFPTWYHAVVYRYVWVMVTIAVLTLIFAVFILFTSTQAIKNDPFAFGMEKNNIDSCSCFTNEGELILFSSNPQPQQQEHLDTNISKWVNTKS